MSVRASTARLAAQRQGKIVRKHNCDAWLQASRHFSATGCHCNCRQFAHAQSKKGKVVF